MSAADGADWLADQLYPRPITDDDINRFQDSLLRESERIY